MNLMSKMTVTDQMVADALVLGVVLPGARAVDREVTVFEEAAVAELLACGYLVDAAVLATVPKNRVVQTVKVARSVSGHDTVFPVQFPDFPAGVTASGDLSDLSDKVSRYTGAGVVPVGLGVELTDALVNARELTVLSWDEARSVLVFTPVMGSGVMSVADRGRLAAVLGSGSVDSATVLDLAGAATNRENVGVLLAEARKADVAPDTAGVVSLVSGARNVDLILRVLLALYTRKGASALDSDYERAVSSLSDDFAFAVQFDSMPMAVRKAVVARVGELTDGEFRADLLVGRRPLWRKVFRSAGSARLVRSDAARRAHDIVFGNVDYRTLDAEVEWLLDVGDVLGAARVLAGHRPGNLFRRAGRLGAALVSTGGEITDLVDVMVGAAHRVSLPVLIGAWNGVANYGTGAVSVRRVAGQSNSMYTSSTVVPDAVREALADGVYRAVVARLADTDGLVVYGVPESDGPVSLGDRDATTTDRDIHRGDRISVPVESGKVVRLFTHWFNSGGRTDVDLSVAVLDDDFRSLGMVGWNTNRRHDATGMVYSGDVTNAPAPDGGAEFVDVDLVKAKAAGGRWVVADLRVYSGKDFHGLDVVSGVMVRDSMDSGEMFEPRSVALSFGSDSPSRHIVPLVFDLDSGEMVWVDSSTGAAGAGSSLSGGFGDVSALVAHEVGRDLFTYGMLAEAVAQAHGEPVDARMTVSRVELDGLLV